MALNWVIAGGGTGGHVTPAIALGERIKERGDRVLFIGSETDIAGRMVSEAGFEMLTLSSQRVMGRRFWGQIMGTFQTLRQVSKARRALLQIQADIVISIGGFAAMPTALAALISRCPITLVEPNAIPGRVNRLTARFARRIFIAFPSAGERLARPDRTLVVGVPLRRSLIEACQKQRQPEQPTAPLRIGVFGGSQGSQQINQAMMQIAPALRDEPLVIFHQAGHADRARVEEAYREAGLDAEVVAFEVDMPSRYRWANLAICRAGALTVAELALSGLPAVLIPYPHAADDHQKANAESLAAVGAALCLDPRPLHNEELLKAITMLAQNRPQLRKMSEAARAQARPDAADRIVRESATLAREKSR